MARIAVFFPHNPWPPRTGAHQRCLAVLRGLRELGASTYFLSADRTSDNPWTAQSAEALRAETVQEVLLYQAAFADKLLVRSCRAYYHLRGRDPRVDSVVYSPPGMKRWFSRALSRIEPDVILMNYACWDALIAAPFRCRCLTIIDTLDLLTLNNRMQAAVHRYFRRWRGKRIPVDAVEDEVLSEAFFTDRAFEVSPRELHIFDRYNATIAIAKEEADLLQRRCPRTAVHFVPMTQTPRHIDNTYAGPAVLPIGPNLFNLQGYVYLVTKVLPTVIRQAPGFNLTVTGTFRQGLLVEPVPGVSLNGFVPDLRPFYREACFLPCPALGGTGQPVKIVEAMAHGVPVVALEWAAERSPLVHGVNGLVARDAREFAEHMVQLWNDRELCRKLGENARETVARECSEQRLHEQLAEIFSVARTIDSATP